MPMYEYRCEECGGNFEKIVRFSEADANQPCPNCGSKRTHRKISVTANLGYASGSDFSSGSSCGNGQFT